MSSSIFAIPNLVNDIVLVDHDFKTIETLRGHTGMVVSVTRLMDGRLASAGLDGKVFVWPNQVIHVGQHIKGLFQIHPDFLVVIRFGSVHQIELSTGFIEHFNLEGVNAITQIRKLKDNTLALGCNDGSVRLFNGDEVRTFYHPCLDMVTCLHESDYSLVVANRSLLSDGYTRRFTEAPITHLDELPNGELVCGHSTYLSVGDQKVHFESKIKCMKVLSNGHVAISLSQLEDGEDGLSLFTYDPDMNRVITQFISEDDPIHTLHELPNGFLVCVTRRGVFVGVYARSVREPAPIALTCVFDNGYDLFLL